MHAFAVLAAAAAVFTAVAATPTPPYPIRARDFAEACPCEDDVAHLTNGFAELVNSTFSASLASDILASGFQDFSDSINFLTGQPYGSATFNGLAAFDAGQSGQTPVPFTILETVQQCTTLVIRWVAYPGAQPARGFTLMHTVQGNGTANGWQIQTQYAEFNVAAWDNDTPGGNCVAPPPPSAAGTSTTSSVLVPTPATSTGAAVAPTAAA